MKDARNLSYFIIDCKPLNPEPLNPEPLNPEPLNPEP
jgi:hypothetical protein